MPSSLQINAVNALCASGISDGWKAFLRSSRPAVIYGAGRQATVVYDFCAMLGKNCRCLLAGTSRKRWGLLPGEAALPLYLLDEVPSQWDKSTFDVIIAVNPAHNEEIAQNLAGRGWPSVMRSDNWEEDNALTRDAFYRAYLRHRGARLVTGRDGKTILEYDGPRGRFKIYFDIDAVYKSALLGDINNIILPSIFDDQTLLGAYGPYEHGEVRLRPGDTVLDLGANIGMFSCVAASIGCEVHAFEPTPQTARSYIQKNSHLYKNIIINEYAVLNCCKQVQFYINNDFLQSLNITRNSIHQDLEPLYKKIYVNAITIDSYVENMGLKHVDFIKSHTEYSEDILLDGAIKTLSKFSPMLSFYSQKFLNIKTWKSIEKKILSANPAYLFEYKWRRMFAWTPTKGNV